MSTLRQRNKNIYWAWKSMKQRCLNPRCRAYKNYGARGITVCKEWLEFEPFCEWALNNGYEHGLDLDREDNFGDYLPENCRWVSRRENINNRRRTLFIEVDGVKMARTEWERQAGLSHGVLKYWVEKHGYEYAASRLKEILESGYVFKDYGFSHRMAVTHVETGKTYKSIKEAARAVGISPSHLRNALRGEGMTKKGRFAFANHKENKWSRWNCLILPQTGYRRGN